MWEGFGHQTQEALVEWVEWGRAERVGRLASAWETGSTHPGLAALVKLGAARGRHSALHIPEQERVAAVVLL